MYITLDIYPFKIEMHTHLYHKPSHYPPYLLSSIILIINGILNIIPLCIKNNAMFTNAISTNDSFHERK